MLYQSLFHYPVSLYLVQLGDIVSLPHVIIMVAIAKLVTTRGDWYECDDLLPVNRITKAPGDNDTSAVILLLVADSLFTH